MKRSGDEAFRAIQSLAREMASGNTQALLEQFVHERFLARLAESQFARQLMPIGKALIDFVTLHQVDWTRFLAQANLAERLPSGLDEVVVALSDFTDPLFDLDLVGASWSPDTQSWLRKGAS